MYDSVHMNPVKFDAHRMRIAFNPPPEVDWKWIGSESNSKCVGESGSHVTRKRYTWQRTERTTTAWILVPYSLFRMAGGWTQAAAKALIGIWGESNVQEQLDTVKQNRNIGGDQCQN